MKLLLPKSIPIVICEEKASKQLQNCTHIVGAVASESGVSDGKRTLVYVNCATLKEVQLDPHHMQHTPGSERVLTLIEQALSLTV